MATESIGGQCLLVPSGPNIYRAILWPGCSDAQVVCVSFLAMLAGFSVEMDKAVLSGFARVYLVQNIVAGFSLLVAYACSLKCFETAL